MYTALTSKTVPGRCSFRNSKSYYPAFAPGKLQMLTCSTRNTVRVMAVPDFRPHIIRLALTASTGVDEAGRGPLAGPVVAAACCIPADVLVEGINDSKKLSAGQREQVFEALIAHPRIATATYVACSLWDKKSCLAVVLGNL